MFLKLWEASFEIVDFIIESYSGIFEFVTTDLSALAVDYPLISKVVDWIGDTIGIEQFSIATILLGPGISIFILICLWKFFFDLI